jgi:hypothetical protein
MSRTFSDAEVDRYLEQFRGLEQSNPEAYQNIKRLADKYRPQTVKPLEGGE